MSTPAFPIPFIQEDIDFLEGLATEATPSIKDTLKQDYVRNLDDGKKRWMENIYKKSINPDFVLDFYCGFCVMRMAKELYAELERQQANALPESENGQDGDNGGPGGASEDEAGKTSGRKKKGE